MYGRHTKYEDLIAPWRTDPKTRDGLLQRLRVSAQKSPSSQNIFTEEAIAQQFYKAWLDLPQTAALQKIAQHPLLTTQMKGKIDEQLQEQKQSQMKWSAGCTAFTVLLYSVFFSRMPRFINFYNKPNSWMITRGLKKTFSVYAVFLLWVASLTNSYEKSLPDDLEKKGLLKDLQLLTKSNTN